MIRANAKPQQILDAVVRLHIETGKPVSSSIVARLLRGAASAATIRMIMKRLEDDGLLLKPHASAGRVPTDRGYRVFVDRLLADWPLQLWELPRHLQQAVREEIQRAAGSHEMIRALASLLSKLTASISIILGPSWDTVRALRVDLYPKEGRRVLMVLVLENALVRTSVVPVDADYPAPIVEEAARILSERICGLTVAEIRSGVLVSLEATISPARRCALELARRGRELFADLEEGEIRLEGVGNVLGEPEFSDPEQLKALVRFLESPVAIREALWRLRPQGAGELAVWIGAENPIGELRSFSLLSSAFAVEGRQGLLAVLGPRRMPYQRAVSSIDAVRRSLQVLG
jgi:heat-inducible transcriptional repressor